MTAARQLDGDLVVCLGDTLDGATVSRFYLPTALVDACGRHDVEIDREASFGFEAARKIRIESPANLRRGIYDVDAIGAFTYLGGRETFIRHVSRIGRFCSIASNIVAGQIEHPTDFLTAHPMFIGAFDWEAANSFRSANQDAVHTAGARFHQLSGRFGKIEIGNDVWIGEGVFIRRGTKIGDGAILASRSVVTCDVPPYAIVGGVPAKIIRYRFSTEVIERLLSLRWWDYGLTALQGVDLTDIHQAITKIEENIASGRAHVYAPAVLEVGPDYVNASDHESVEISTAVAYHNATGSLETSAGFRRLADGLKHAKAKILRRLTSN
ncbi:hypothetical protein BTE77_08285 [Ensifer adhaerens]|nr:hypothetical protein BTE77_08285 [Ensifer adhaerens]